MQQQQSPSEQIASLTKQLTDLYVRKDDAARQVADAEKSIDAIRNVLAGVNLGGAAAEEARPSEQPDTIPSE
jgi:hypothetical protein